MLSNLREDYRVHIAVRELGGNVRAEESCVLVRKGDDINALGVIQQTNTPSQLLQSIGATVDRLYCIIK